MSVPWPNPLERTDSEAGVKPPGARAQPDPNRPRGAVCSQGASPAGPSELSKCYCRPTTEFTGNLGAMKATLLVQLKSHRSDMVCSMTMSPEGTMPAEKMDLDERLEYLQIMPPNHRIRGRCLIPFSIPSICSPRLNGWRSWQPLLCASPQAKASRGSDYSSKLYRQ